MKVGTERRPVDHVFGCMEEDCEVGRANRDFFDNGLSGPNGFYEGMVVATGGKVESVHLDGEIVDARCSTCDQAMSVVHLALNIGRRSGGRSSLGDGIEVTSPDRSVCAEGRQFLGGAAMRDLKPGEQVVANVAGGAFDVRRSAGGRNVEVVRVI